MDRFTDHGIPAEAVESRTGAVCTNESGDTRIVLAARGFLLIVKHDTGVCKQLPFPDGLKEYPYISFADSRGLFYTGAGTLFMVLDPFQEQYVFAKHAGEPGELVGFSFAEDKHGAVYFTAYPHCRLFRYEPKHYELTSFGKMDEEEKYPSHLAADRFGWVYAGIGTEKKNIVAFHPESGEKRFLLPESERSRGMGVVHKGEDGAVYGHWHFRDLRETETPEHYQWMRFENGKAVHVAMEAVSPSLYQGEGFYRLHRKLPGHMQVERHDLAERELVLVNKDSKERRIINLEYTCEGAQLSPMVTGPDGHIYGTSNHPLHFYKYDTKESRIVNYGGKAIEFGGGGNICAYAVTGSLIGGAAYAGGHVHLFDVSRPVQVEGEQRNPRMVAKHAEIHRPRSALAHSDGEHMIFGGFPGYGAVGGGLCIYNVTTGRDAILTHEQVVPNHSTLCLVEANNGDVFGATSVETPGGARPKDSIAKIYRLRWSDKTVAEMWSPVEVREIHWIHLDRLGLIHGLTSSTQYFVFDPNNGALIHHADLSSWGDPVRIGFVQGPDDILYGVLSQAVYRISTDTFDSERLAVPPAPITAGLAKSGKSLFFGIEARLWSFRLPS